jgi:predicted nucleic acid-binding protein
MAMTIVIDASAVIDVVCDLGESIRVQAALERDDAVFAPAHLDAEVLSALGRLTRAGQLIDPEPRVRQVVRFGAIRLPLPFLLPHAWALVGRVAVKDALYVALTRTLDASLLTTDNRLARAVEGIVPLA